MKGLCLLIFTIILVGCSGSNRNLSTKIIETIDTKYIKGDTCTFSMQEITDFEWDRFIVYNVGSSNSEISKLLGIDYEDSVDLMYGMVFAYKDKIVYKESLPYNPEKPNKLWISFDNKPSEPNCFLFSKENDSFKGLREKVGGKNYYQLLLNK